MFKRPIYAILLQRLREPRRFIQVLAGPRQVGKTTLIEQLLEELTIPTLYVSADEPTLKDHYWIEQQWEIARQHLSKTSENALLIIDEIQKIPAWSETVKKCWDEDTRHKRALKVVLLGSAPLLVQKGLTESLAGRFEQISITHWTFQEMQSAFGWTMDEYIYFGGYPGAAELIHDEKRWARYINDSLIETSLSRDILLLNPIHKPALLRRLFYLCCEYSGQILSYQKMLGQLHDVGNTTTLAHYLSLLSGAGMVSGLSKFVGKKIRERGSSPKLQVFNTALLSAHAHYTFEEAKKDRDYWGRLVESTVGAYLLNSALSQQVEVFYWREGDQEVDFILRWGKKVLAIEVKSSARKTTTGGMAACQKQFNVTRSLLVGGQGLPLEKFFNIPLHQWFDSDTTKI